jgi:hypothetical protein
MLKWGRTRFGRCRRQGGVKSPTDKYPNRNKQRESFGEDSKVGGWVATCIHLPGKASE